MIGIGIGINKTIFTSAGEGSSFDEDYQAVLDYATTQVPPYTLPSLSQQVLQNQLVIDLKDAGIWSKLDTFAVFATDGDSDFALIDWKRLSQYTAVNSPTFTTNEGFKGNGVSAYLNNNFNPTTNGVNYTQNDASRYVYPFFGQGTEQIDVLANNPSNVVNRMRFVGNNNNINTNTGGLGGLTLVYQLKSVHRTSSTSMTLCNGKSTTTGTSTSLFLPNDSQWISRSSTGFMTVGVSLYAMGASLVAENDDFVDAFDNYLNSL
jgi:hypothetical protein